jgi:hypothetical protein
VRHFVGVRAGGDQLLCKFPASLQRWEGLSCGENAPSGSS